MLRSWKLGSAFGIGVYVHWTLLVLLGFVGLTFWQLGGAEAALYGFSLGLALFGCVLLHELGHALTARHFGITTRDITLYLIGGIARLERMSERPWEEFWIAVAGPAVNLALAVLLSVPILLGLDTPPLGWADRAGGLGSGFLADLRLMNLALMLFNLLPAFPMDGGRVLRALLVPLLGRLPATQVAAVLGAIFAVLLALSGLSSNPLLVVVAAFVFLAGQQELFAVFQRERSRRAQPLDALPAANEILDVVPVPTGVHFTAAVWDGRTRVWTLWRDGRPVQTFGAE